MIPRSFRMCVWTFRCFVVRWFNSSFLSCPMFCQFLLTWIFYIQRVFPCRPVKHECQQAQTAIVGRVSIPDTKSYMPPSCVALRTVFSFISLCTIYWPERDTDTQVETWAKPDIHADVFPLNELLSRMLETFQEQMLGHMSMGIRTHRPISKMRS